MSDHQSNLDKVQRPLVVVGIGASAGGLEALETFLANLPSDSGMAFVLVQHLDPAHPSLMPELLARHTKIPIHVASDGMRVEADQLYVMPPNVTLRIHDGVLQTSSPIEHATVRTHVDTFLRSLAEDRAEHAVGVVLSGAGSDGTLGLKAIKEHGGITMVQSPESAKYDSMPLSAIATGLVDHTLPVAEIPGALVEHAKYLANLGQKVSVDALRQDAASQLPRVCEILHHATGHDFGGYKPSTMVRRMERRMQVHRLDSVAAYVAKLESDASEPTELFKDLLIGVTQFFRDTEAFDALAGVAIPRLLEGKPKVVRLWVTGCASGEEAYSIAILLSEYTTQHNVAPTVQIFATDIDEDAIAAARLGRYPASAVEHVSAERREHFFVQDREFYQVRKPLRDMVVFSLHNLVRDPPFSMLNLVSCRNLLIYMEAGLQQKLVPLFHYALVPDGFLFLGSSEGLSGSAELFRTVDKKHRIFQRAEPAVRPAVVFPLGAPQSLGRLSLPASPARRPERGTIGDIGLMEERLALQYAPPCVIINERSEIVYLARETSLFLQPSTGAPTASLVDQARKGLRSILRGAVREAIESGTPVVRAAIRVKTPSGLRLIDLVVRPMPESGTGAKVAGRLWAVVFQPTVKAPTEPPAEAVGSSEESAMQQLETELKATRTELQQTVEDLEAANQDLKSSNEELLSMNEEMQSANEELQTSKEEMQSVNEELGTVNTELSRKVDQLDHANADLQNLFRSNQIATLFLDRELRIKRFTPAATGLFHLRESDVGRPIADLAPRFAKGNLVAQMREVLQTLATKEQHVFLPESHTWFSVRILPSRTTDNAIDGVVVTFVDITELRQALDTVRQTQERVSQLNDTIPHLAWTARPDGTIDYCNERVHQYQGFQHRPDGTWDLAPALHPDDAAGTLQAWAQAIQTGQDYQMEHRLRLLDGQWRWHLCRAVPIRDQQGRVSQWSGTATDIHDMRTLQEQLAAAKDVAEHASRAKDNFLAALSHELRTPLSPILAIANLLRADTCLDADTRAQLEVISRNAELEARLIDDLLDVTRIEQGKVELNRRPIELCTILRQAVEVCQPDIEESKVEFGLDLGADAPYFVDADPTRLQQVFWNLLKNSIKFTPSGGCVGIRCQLDGKSFVVAEVTDSGAGIKPEDLLRIFNTFEQADRAVTRQFGGLGLGLAISKRIVEMHGGSIHARSEGPGKGATFAVRLPLVPAPLRGAASSPAPAPPHERLRILLVEDHGDTARVMQRAMSIQGHEVQCAGDVATAMQLANRQTFDVVLSDLSLPDASGLDLLRALRTKGITVPAVALSGFGQEKDIQESRAAGFAAHLVKPVNMTKLLEVMSQVVGDSRRAV